MAKKEVFSIKGLLRLCVSLILVVGLCVSCLSCGKGSGEGLLKRELPENATPEKIMLEALKTTDEAKTLSYTFEYSLVIPPYGGKTYTSEVRLEGEGQYEASSGNAKVHITWPAFETEFDYVLYQGKPYFRPAGRDKWYEMPSSTQFTFPSIAELTRDASEYINNFQRITRMADEPVGERDCYHISLVPDFDTILQNENFLNMVFPEGTLDEEATEKLKELRERLRGASVNYEYWIDKEYLVLRKTHYSVELQEPGDEKNPPFTIRLVMTLYFPSYNVEVNIERPQPVASS
ncbi:MAG: hypothetical protein WHT46_05455 [Candidatus Geothermincolales bacterium]